VRERGASVQTGRGPRSVICGALGFQIAAGACLTTKSVDLNALPL
jgi:hypothetical protein